MTNSYSTLQHHPLFWAAIKAINPKVLDYYRHSGVKLFPCPVHGGDNANFEVDADTGWSKCRSGCRGRTYSPLQLAALMTDGLQGFDPRDTLKGFPYGGFAEKVINTISDMEKGLVKTPDSDVEIRVNKRAPKAFSEKVRKHPVLRTQDEFDAEAVSRAEKAGAYIRSNLPDRPPYAMRDEDSGDEDSIYRRASECAPADVRGVVKAIQVRFENALGKKTFSIVTPIGDGRYVHRELFDDEQRPLMFTGDTDSDKPRVVVSGRYGGEVAARVLGDDYVVVTDIWGDTTAHTHYDDLRVAGRGCTVIFWPDGDAGSRLGMEKASQRVREAGGDIRWVTPLDSKVSGATGGDIVDLAVGEGQSKQDIKLGAEVTAEACERILGRLRDALGGEAGEPGEPSGESGGSSAGIDRRKKRVAIPPNAWRYDYSDESGEVICITARKHPKAFARPYVPAGDGMYVQAMPDRPLPFRYPELLARPELPVVVCDDEADAAALSGLRGYVAASFASDDWAATDWGFLRGREISVWFRNSARAQSSASAMAARLSADGHDIRRVRPCRGVGQGATEMIDRQGIQEAERHIRENEADGADDTDKAVIENELWKVLNFTANSHCQSMSVHAQNEGEVRDIPVGAGRDELRLVATDDELRASIGIEGSGALTRDECARITGIWQNWCRQSRHYHDPTKLHGLGASRIDGVPVFNFGDMVLQGGEIVPFGVEHCTHLLGCDPQDLPLADYDEAAVHAGMRMLLAKLGQFKFSGSVPAAEIIIGHAATSLLGGCDGFRSHLSIAGEGGSGKSSIVKEFMRPLLNGYALSAGQGSTAVSIYNDCASHSLPMLLDEVEPGRSDRDPKTLYLNNVRTIMRGSSDGTETRKVANGTTGTNRTYTPRCSFTLVRNLTETENRYPDQSRLFSLFTRKGGIAGSWDDFIEEPRESFRAGLGHQWTGMMILSIAEYDRRVKLLRDYVAGKTDSGRTVDMVTSTAVGCAMSLGWGEAETEALSDDIRGMFEKQVSSHAQPDYEEGLAKLFKHNAHARQFDATQPTVAGLVKQARRTEAVSSAPTNNAELLMGVGSQPDDWLAAAGIYRKGDEGVVIQTKDPKNAEIVKAAGFHGSLDAALESCPYAKKLANPVHTKVRRVRGYLLPYSELERLVDCGTSGKPGTDAPQGNPAGERPDSSECPADF